MKRACQNVEKVAFRHFFEHSQVLPLAFAPGRQNLQRTKTSGGSSVLTHTPPGDLLLPLRGNSPCVVRAEWNIRGRGPLSTPGFFDNRSPSKTEGLFLCNFCFKENRDTLK